MGKTDPTLWQRPSIMYLVVEHWICHEITRLFHIPSYHLSTDGYSSVRNNKISVSQHDIESFGTEKFKR